jgi:hypothetical protein
VEEKETECTLFGDSQRQQSLLQLARAHEDEKTDLKKVTENGVKIGIGRHKLGKK